MATKLNKNKQHFLQNRKTLYSSISKGLYPQKTYGITGNKTYTESMHGVIYYYREHDEI